MGGTLVPKDNWVYLDIVSQSLSGYLNKPVYDNQPSRGYEYSLAAVDQAGNDARTPVRLTIVSQPLGGYYNVRLILRSTNSLVINSYSDVHILFLLQARMSSYLTVAEADFIPENFKVNRTGSTSAHIDYTWSVKAMSVDPCDTNFIVTLRTKLLSNNGAIFKELFATQFTLTDWTEQFTGACNNLSSNPSTIGVTIPTLNVQLGRYFSYAIPPNAFSSPSGSSMRLTLELRYTNGTVVSGDNWIILNGVYLDQDPKLEGVASLKVAMQQKQFSTHSFNLIAITPLMVENSQTIQMDIQGSVSTKLTYIVTMVQNLAISLTFTTFVQSFNTYMTSYLSISSSRILIVEFEKTMSSTMVKWTVSNITADPCDISKLDQITGMMVSSSGVVNQNMRSGLSSSVGFSPDSVKVTKSGSCDPPQIRKTIPPLDVPKYGELNYIIPFDAFYDGTDEYNVRISLLTDFAASLPLNSWISFNNSTRSIFGMPLTDNLGGSGSQSEYIIRAMDTDGVYVDQRITVTVNWTAPQWSQRFWVNMKYSLSSTTQAYVTSLYISKLKSYLGDVGRNNIIVNKVIFITSSKTVRLFWQNTTFRYSPCDTHSKNAILTQLRQDVSQNPPNLAFSAFLEPQFRVLEVIIDLIGPCLQLNQPQFDWNYLYLSGPNYLAYCDTYKLQIPALMFTDEEDGNARNLQLSMSLNSHPNTALDVNSWVNFISSSQMIIAVPSDHAYQNLPSNGRYTYKLTAVDSDGKSVSVQFMYGLTGSPPISFYNVTFSFKVYGIAQKFYPEQIDIFRQELYKVFGSDPKIYASSFTLNIQSGSNGEGTFTWRPCGMPSGSCNFTLINTIRSIMFSSGSKNIGSQLQGRLGGYFEIVAISEASSGPCAENPPRINQQIPLQNISFCGPFKYQIPADTFLDVEDGNTRNLGLKLLQNDGNALLADSWIQFDSVKQEVFAILTETQAHPSYPRVHKFKLIAKDESGLETTLVLNVSISGTNPQSSYRIILEAKVDISIPLPMYFLSKKVGAYLGDSGKGFLAISYQRSSSNTGVFTWSNCTMRYSPCDAVGLHWLRNKLKTSSGTLQTSFQQALGPEFSQITLDDVVSGPCSNDQPPEVSNIFGPLTVDTCKTYAFQVPANTFKDREQGNTKNLSLKLLMSNSSQLNKDLWVDFDNIKQKITVLGTNQIASRLSGKRMVFILEAVDLAGQSASQQLEIMINILPVLATHSITMQYKLKSVTSKTTFVTLYDSMRNAMTQYLGSSATSIEFDSLPSTLQMNIFLTANCSSCSLSRTHCDASTLTELSAKLLLGSQINTAFKAALQGSFEVYSVTFNQQGVCADETSPPRLANPVPDIFLRYCGYIRYRIPENTFFDIIDGNTRNLSLTLKNSDGTALGNMNWVYFDTQLQTIIAVIHDDAWPHGHTIPKYFNFLLTATSKRGLSSTANVRLVSDEIHPNASFYLVLNLLWIRNSIPNRVIIMSTMMDRIALYFGGTIEQLHYLAFSTDKAYTTFFSVKIGNCSIQYDPCDQAGIEQIKSKVFSEAGTLPGFINVFRPAIEIISAQGIQIGPCQIKNVPPRVLNPIGTITVKPCSNFTYIIPKDTFIDEEDGSNMDYQITKINRIGILSGIYVWISVRSSLRTLLGIVTETVIKNQPASGYMITLRATDSNAQYVETDFTVKILGNSPQTFYQAKFDLSLKATSFFPVWMFEEASITTTLNLYFKSNITNIMTHQAPTASQSKDFSITWAICTLPRKCDERAASDVYNKMLTSQNKVVTQLSEAFSWRYTIKAITKVIDPLCQGPVNPPVPSRKTWLIEASYCGGFKAIVPQDLFIDPEQGNSRTLTLSMYAGDKKALSSNNWLQFNSSTQTVYGTPTRDQTIGYTSSPKNFTLYATDKTGLDASIAIKFSFAVKENPTYKLKIRYSSHKIWGSYVDEVINFMSRTSTYLGQRTASSFGLLAYEATGNVKYLTYANCSISYNPCNLAALEALRLNLLQSRGLPQPSYSSAMQPYFTISYGYPRKEGSCSGSPTNPPRLVNAITILNISLCISYSYQIPSNVFYDPEDGNTRKLKLSLTTNGNQAVNFISWIQIDTSQTINAIAMATIAQSQPSDGYTFILTATDSSSLTTSNTFRAQITGPFRELYECQIQTKLSSTSSLTSLDNIALSKFVISKLAAYFTSLSSSQEIGVVSLIRHSNTSFTFSWSYCSSQYRQNYGSSSHMSSQAIQIDYHGFMTKILLKLYMEDGKTIRSQFYSAFDGFTVESVNRVFTGRCADFPPSYIQGGSQITLFVTNCGYRKMLVRKNWYQDVEDGHAHLLGLSILDKNGKKVSLDHWVNIDNSTKEIMVTLGDAQRNSVQNTFLHYLQATDSKGQSANVTLMIKKIQTAGISSSFSITYEQIYKGHPLTTFVSQTVYLMDKIAAFYSLTDGQAIALKRFTHGHGLPESRIIEWTVCATELCSSAVLSKTRSIFSLSNGLSNSARQAFLPLFQVTRVHYKTTCSPTIDPPTKPDTIPALNTTYCSIFRYNLPPTLFADRRDGDLRSLKLQLLDNNGNPVSSASWVQLSTPNMQLFAVAISSISLQISRNYKIEATNSGGLKAYSSFTINNVNYPYTSDCLATIQVKAGNIISHKVDLDVLVHLLDLIRQYYGDTKIKMKVHTFYKMADNIYTLIFSNCSFVFNNLTRALYGLDESYRPTIEATFSRMVQSNNVIRTEFREALSSFFEILKVSVSYSCIEEPPYTTQTTSMKAYAYVCEEFCDVVPMSLFLDKRDGNTRNLMLSLQYLDGKLISLNEWIYMNDSNQAVCGAVTESVKRNAPLKGYEYLLVATDSSGRSASIKYSIKIANSLPNVQVKFVIGYKNTFDYYAPTAKILLSVTKKLAIYLDPTDKRKRILIHSYQATNALTWSYCPLPCTPAKMNEIVPRMQNVAYKTIPHQSMISALMAEFDLYYVYVDGPKCVETVSITIVNPTPPSSNQKICGLLSYKIPSNIFNDQFGRTAQDFLLQLYSASGQSLLTSSYVQFDSTTQSVYGIAVAMKLTSTVRYQLKASHPKSDTSKTTVLTLNFPDYNLINNLPRVCTITVSLTTKYNPGFNDVFILTRILEKLAGYFNTEVQQLQIVSYTRITNSYPIKISFRFTNCSWLYIVQGGSQMESYYNHVQLTMQKMLKYKGSTMTGYSRALYNALQPDFYIQSVVANTSCSKPPNSPPKQNKTLDVLKAPTCGEFNYQIPSDLFSDEDGNTRKLKLEFLQVDGTEIPVKNWVVINTTSQILAGLPDKETFANQPSDGYRYIIKATDKEGLSSNIQIIIKLEGNPIKSEKLGLSINGQILATTKYEMDTILFLTRQLSSYKDINDPLNRVFVYFKVVVSIGTATNFLIRVANCSVCSSEAFAKYYSLSLSKQSFINYMNPMTDVKLVTLEQIQECDEDEEVLPSSSLDVHFCKKYSRGFWLIAGTSTLNPAWNYIIRDEKFQPLPKSSWFWINETSNIFEAFPSIDVWRTIYSNGTAFLWTITRKSDNNQISNRIKKFIKIRGTPSYSGLLYKIIIETTHSSSNTDAYFISVIWSSLETFLGRSDFQYISLERRIGEPLQLTYAWMICGLPSNCSVPDVQKLDDNIFVSFGVLHEGLKASFPSGFKVIRVESNCKNKPPEVKMQILNLTIPICGFYKYKLSDDFATDAEDGDLRNLAVLLRMPDGGLIPVDSWIRFNETSKEIYAFPTESIADSQLTDGYLYSLIIQDRNGKSGNTSLRVFVENDKNHYYQLIITFQSLLDPNIPYLDLQVRMLSMISAFAGDGTLNSYRVLAFTKTSSALEYYYLKWENCSVNEYICKSKEQSLRQIEHLFTTFDSDPMTQFSSYVSRYFRPMSFKTETSYKLDQPPRLVTRMDIVKVTICQMYIGDIPASTFYDIENGNTNNLKLTLTHPNGTRISPNYWIQLIDKKFYVVPSGNIQSGYYNTTLTATDSCGHSTSMFITTYLNNPIPSMGYQVTMTTTYQSKAYPDVFYIRSFMQKLQSFYRSQLYNIRVVRYRRSQNSLELSWVNCSVIYQPCDKETIRKIQNNLFVAYNIVNPEIQVAFKPDYNISTIMDERSENCSSPPSLPPVANRSLTAEVKLCQKLDFKVPMDTFYDPEEGNTRNLSLSLLKENKQALDLDSWVQIDRTSQTIYGYPRINSPRKYKYQLIASDAQENTASAPVDISIIGNLPSVAYKLMLSGTTKIDKSSPNVEQEIQLIQKIGNYFGDYAINDIRFSRRNDLITFEWSFCNRRTDRCNCYFIRHVRNRITPLTDFQQYMRPDYEVTSITETMEGVCRVTQSPQLEHDWNIISIDSGQTFTYTIPDNKFVDYEDGNTRNLTLYMQDDNNTILDSLNWIKIQQLRMCGVLSLHEMRKLGWLKTSRTKYNMVAEDSCGKKRLDSFWIDLSQAKPTLSFVIYVYILMPHSDLKGNCSKIERFIEKLSTYIETRKEYIYIENIAQYQNASYNTSVVAWGLRNLTEKNCHNEAIQKIREKFITNDSSVNPTFQKHMGTEYEVTDVKANRTAGCYNATILVPIIPPGPDFPWWILILLLILAILFLLLWCCWILIPRCCPPGGCCESFCGCCKGCCAKCCSPGGKYASLEEEGISPHAGQGSDGGNKDAGKNAAVAPMDDPVDPPDSLVPPPPYKQLPDPITDKAGMETIPDPDGDVSSGFKEEDLSDDFNEYEDGQLARPGTDGTKHGSEDSGIIESDLDQRNTEPIIAPTNISSPPPAVVPPLYTATKMDPHDLSLDGAGDSMGRDMFDEDALNYRRTSDDVFLLGDTSGEDIMHTDASGLGSRQATEETILKAADISMAESAVPISEKFNEALSLPEYPLLPQPTENSMSQSRFKQEATLDNIMSQNLMSQYMGAQNMMSQNMLSQSMISQDTQTQSVSQDDTPQQFSRDSSSYGAGYMYSFSESRDMQDSNYQPQTLTLPSTAPVRGRRTMTVPRNALSYEDSGYYRRDINESAYIPRNARGHSLTLENEGPAITEGGSMSQSLDRRSRKMSNVRIIQDDRRIMRANRGQEIPVRLTDDGQASVYVTRKKRVRRASEGDILLYQPIKLQADNSYYDAKAVDDNQVFTTYEPAYSNIYQQGYRQSRRQSRSLSNLRTEPNDGIKVQLLDDRKGSSVRRGSLKKIRVVQTYGYVCRSVYFYILFTFERINIKGVIDFILSFVCKLKTACV